MKNNHTKDQTIQPASLRKLNLVMGTLHALQGIIMLSLATGFKLPLTVAFLDFNPTLQKLFLTSKEIAQVPLAWIIVAFLFVSAIAHFSIATWYRPTYEKDLALGINKARWWEYTISASIMMVAIAMLVGLYDLASLIMLFSLVSGMNLMGLVMEVYNRTEKPNWLAYNIGCFLGIIPWLVVAIYFWASAQYGAGEIPTFVYYIYGSIFLFFNCFAITMVLQYKKVGKFADYVFGERSYIWLSLIAKSLLAWQVFAGTLRP